MPHIIIFPDLWFRELADAIGKSKAKKGRFFALKTYMALGIFLVSTRSLNYSEQCFCKNRIGPQELISRLRARLCALRENLQREKENIT